MYTTMYPIYMAYIGQYEGISRKQLVGHSPKGTHIFPLIDSPETFSVNHNYNYNLSKIHNVTVPLPGLFD